MHNIRKCGLHIFFSLYEILTVNLFSGYKRLLKCLRLLHTLWMSVRACEGLPKIKSDMQAYIEEEKNISLLSKWQSPVVQNIIKNWSNKNYKAAELGGFKSSMCFRRAH